MVWALLGKDVRRFWWLIALVAITQALLAFVQARTGLFVEYHWPSLLVRYQDPIALLWKIGAGVLIILTVQRNPIPKHGEAWPDDQRPGEVLFSKLLLVLCAVMLPVFTADLSVALWQGRGAEEALVIGLSHTVFVFVTFALPAMALAAMTANLAEALAVTFFIYLLTHEAAIFAIGVPALEELSAGGVGWVPIAANATLILFGALLVFPLQYFGRFTIAARMLFGVFVLAAVAVVMIPWKQAFAIEEFLSPHPEVDRGVAIAYDATAGRATTTARQNPASKFLSVPVRIDGVPPHAILRTDRLRVRVLGLDGAVLAVHRPLSVEYGLMLYNAADPRQSVLSVHTDDRPGNAIHKHQLFGVAKDLYPGIRNRPVRIEIDYAFTILTATPQVRIPALTDRNVQTPYGQCAARATPDYERQVQVFCYKSIFAPSCLSYTAENRITKQRNLPETWCYTGDYAPPPLRAAMMTRSRMGQQLAVYSFFHYGSDADYPVEWPQVGSTDLVFTGYEPEAHFSRTVLSPVVRLADLEPEVRPYEPSRSKAMPR